MTFGAWKTGRLPLDGARADVHARSRPREGERPERRFRRQRLPVRSANSSPGASRGKSRWYGGRRSYRVAFDWALGWRAEATAEDGVAEICEALEAGAVDKTVQTVTFDWYKELARRLVREVEMYGGEI